jgi:type III restriction enzyme
MVADTPILNSPYEEPRRHYATDDSGALDYARIAEGRRIFAPEVQAIPIRQGPQASIIEINDRGAEYGTR